MAAIVVRPGQEFEEALEMRWNVSAKAAGTFKEFVVELTIDLVERGENRATARPLPPKNATVKKISFGGMDVEGCIQNMPEGRNFLVRVVGVLRVPPASSEETAAGRTRSKWICIRTLTPASRENNVDNFDPMHMPRLNCKHCPCAGYVPFRWALNTPELMRCRRCGCHYTEHVLVNVGDILRAREERACTLMRKESVQPLPGEEALDWDSRECNLWFASAGSFHPRAFASSAQAQTRPSGRSPEARVGCKGRLSVVTPTTEPRQRFHELLYRCFDAQDWPDKELVVVETYQDKPSRFFKRTAEKDPRIIYVTFQRPKGDDWSIGLKRNIAAHLSTGEFLANFDDDDLYAPNYASTMVARLEEANAQAITLSSWYVHNIESRAWSFCHPIAWGLTRGKDENDRQVRSFVYGYGFSYVCRRQLALDVMYDDMNLGEDFHFLQQVIARRGEKAVRLVDDDFGICLHVQHGGNTSDSIPLRDVPLEEARNLDVTALAPHFTQLGSSEDSIITASPAGGFFKQLGANPGERSQRVRAHTPFGTVEVCCAVGVTTAQFLLNLQLQIPDIAVGSLQVLRVPPRIAILGLGAAWEEGAEEADTLAADVLGISFLARQPEAEEHLRVETKSGKQWRKLLEDARRPMRPLDRIGLRVSELWLERRESEADEIFEDSGPRESLITVQGTCQAASVNAESYLRTGNGRFAVRLTSGSDIADFRAVLGAALPPRTKVYEDRPGRGLVALLDEDIVPENVVVSHFKGPRKFFTYFTAGQCGIVLRMMRAFWRKAENQKQLDALERDAKGNSLHYRSSLLKILADEAYPSILRHLDLPDDEQGPMVIMDGMGHVHSNFELAELWLEVETLMRNTKSMEEAAGRVAELRDAQLTERE